MFETVQRDKIIMGSNKSFGYVFTIVFLILSIYPYFVRMLTKVLFNSKLFKCYH